MKVTPRSTSLFVQWNPPTEAECVGSYKVSYNLENGDDFPEEETKDLQMEFTDLEPCVFYNVIVTAVPKNTTKSGASRSLGSTTIESSKSLLSKRFLFMNGVFFNVFESSWGDGVDTE